MENIVENIRKMNLQDGDIIIMPATIPIETRIILNKEINAIYPDKRIGVIYVDNPEGVRIIKANEFTNQ